MQVLVNNTCDRCGKTTQIPVSIEEMNNLMSAQTKQTEELKNLEAFCTQQLSAGPEVIVCLKEADGYKIQAYNNLCERPGDTKKKRSCKNRVRALVQEIFMPPKNGIKKERKVTPKIKNNKDKDK